MPLLHRALAAAGVLVLAFVVVGLAAFAISDQATGDERVVAAVVAALLGTLLLAAGLGLLARRGRAQWRPATLDGEPAAFVPYRIARLKPATWILGALTVALALGLVASWRDEATGLAVLLALLLAGSAATGWSLQAAAARRPGVVVGSRSLEVRTFHRRTRVPWSAVAAITAEARGWTPVVRFLVDTEVEGAEVERHRRLVRLEPDTHDVLVEIEGAWLGADWLDVLTRLQQVAGDADAREGLIAGV